MPLQSVIDYKLILQCNTKDVIRLSLTAMGVDPAVYADDYLRLRFDIKRGSLRG